MTEQIYNLQYKDLLFFDVETVRSEENFDENSTSFNIWQHKNRNRENNELPETQKTIELYKNKAALNPIFGKIVCITTGYVHNETIHLKSYTGDEKTILRDFVSMVKNSNRKLVGVNITQFDLPYTRQRFFINRLSNYLNKRQGLDVGVKPWDLEEVIVDLMKLWQGTYYYPSSLNEMCYAFGVKSPKDDIDGSQVSDAYYRGEIDRIVHYCEKDVVAVINILRTWREEPQLEYEGHKEEEKLILNPDLYKNLYAAGKLTKQTKDIIKLKSQQLNKNEKEKFVTLIKAALNKDKFLKTEEKFLETILNQ